jgi:hypothetical protein
MSRLDHFLMEGEKSPSRGTYITFSEHEYSRPRLRTVTPSSHPFRNQFRGDGESIAG